MSALPATVREAVLAHGREAAPDEACGLLLGGERRVERSRRTANVAADPRTGYEVPPEAVLAAVDDGLVGFYHTHPRGPAGPSDRDRRAAAWPGYLYAVADLRTGAVGAWRWTGEAFVAAD